MATVMETLKMEAEFIGKNRSLLPGYQYKSIPELVLKEGMCFNPRKLPSNYFIGEQKECFRNASLLSIDKNLIYCEGYAFSKPIEGLNIFHAWCCDENKNVIDNTWKNSGTQYFGIAFDKEFLMGCLKKQKVYGLIDNWHDRFPLLKEFKREYKHRFR